MRRRNENYRIASQERQSEIFLNFATDDFFRVINCNVDVHVKRQKRADELLFALQLYQNFLAFRLIQKIKRSLNSVNHVASHFPTYLNLSLQKLKLNKNSTK